mgnify:CR=1 FL=1
MGAPLKKALQYLVSVALMVAFALLAIEGTDLTALWASLLTVSPAWLLVITGTTVLTLVLRAWRWVVLMRSFAPSVTVFDAGRALSICYAANVFVPRSGELLRALSLKWSRGTNISSVLGTVVVERILDVVWLLIFVGISILLHRERIFSAFSWIGWFSLTILACCALALVVLVLVSVYRDRALVAIEAGISRLSLRLANAVVRLMDMFLQGITALHTPSAYLEIALSSVLLNVGYVIIVYEGFASVGLSPDWNAAIVVMALSAIGMSIPSPGGIGSYHYFFMQGLVLLYAVDEDPALACAIVVHGVANVTYLALGLPALLLQRWRPPGAGPDVDRKVSGAAPNQAP